MLSLEFECIINYDCIGRSTPKDHLLLALFSVNSILWIPGIYIIRYIQVQYMTQTVGSRFAVDIAQATGKGYVIRHNVSTVKPTINSGLLSHIFYNRKRCVMYNNYIGHTT